MAKDFTGLRIDEETLKKVDTLAKKRAELEAI